MNSSLQPLGYNALSLPPDELDNSVASPVDLIRDDMSVKRVYVAEITNADRDWERQYALGNLYHVVYPRCFARNKNRWYAMSTKYFNSSGNPSSVFLTSEDGYSWSTLASVAHAGASTAYSWFQRIGSTFYAGHPASTIGGANGTYNSFYQTTDFSTFTSAPKPGVSNPGVPHFFSSVFLYAHASTVYHSVDGSAWTTATVSTTNASALKIADWGDSFFDSYTSSIVIYDKSRLGYVAGSRSQFIMSTDNGASWTHVLPNSTDSSALTDYQIGSMAADGKGGYCIVTENGPSYNSHIFFASSLTGNYASVVASALLSSDAGSYKINRIRYNEQAEFWYMTCSKSGVSGSSKHAHSYDGKTWYEVFPEVADVSFTEFDINQETGQMIGCSGYNVFNASTAAQLMVMEPATIRVATEFYECSSKVYEARLENPANFSKQVSVNGDFIAGKSRVSYGTMTILNGDGRYDTLLNDDWDSRSFTVKFGTASMDISEFGSVYQGRVREATWDDSRIYLSLRDGQANLDTVFQRNVYASSYGSSLFGKPIPLTYGKVINITPTRISQASSVFQFSASAVASVTAVYQNGVTALATTTGGYVANTSAGTLEFDTTITDHVTMDITGATSAGIYAPQLAINILVGRLGFVDADFDNSVLTALRKRSYYVGMYIDADTTIRQVIDELAYSTGCLWGFNRDGQFFMKTMEPPGTVFRSFGKDRIKSIKRVSSPNLVWSVKYGYDKNWTVQRDADLAGAVTTARRQYLAEEYRVKTYISSATRDEHPLAREVEINSVIRDGASTIAEDLYNLYSTHRDVYEVVVGVVTHDLEEGQTIEIVYDRFGLDSGGAFRLIGFTENIRANEVTMMLWR